MKAPPFRAAPSMSFPSDMAVHDRDQQILFPGLLQICIERLPISLPAASRGIVHAEPAHPACFVPLAVRCDEGVGGKVGHLPRVVLLGAALLGVV